MIEHLDLNDDETADFAVRGLVASLLADDGPDLHAELFWWECVQRLDPTEAFRVLLDLTVKYAARREDGDTLSPQMRWITHMMPDFPAETESTPCRP